MRTLILSDIHLGHPATRVRAAEQLYPLTKDFDQVILNGDSVEQRFAKEKAPGAKHLAEFLEVLGKKQVNFLCGNHDPFISKEHTKELNEAILITHGDILCPDLLSNHDLVMDKRIGQIKRSQTDLSNGSRVKYFVFNTMPPNKLMYAINLWRKHHKHVSNLNYPQAYKFIITGHVHKAGINEDHGQISINTGSFMALSRPLAVIVDDEQRSLEVHSITLRKDGFHLGRLVEAYTY